VDHPQPIYTPDNEPYLGRMSVFGFDKQISFTLYVNGFIAGYTRAHRSELSPLQTAAAQIIPQGISLALSIRELIRQGYLFGALVLVRPLIERAGMISYLQLHPEAVEIWHSGWRFRERPSLSKMLEAMAGDADPEMAKQICEHYGYIVHGDPVGAESNKIFVGGGQACYAVSRILDAYELCDEIAIQAHCYLTVLTGRMIACFPEAAPPSSVERPV